MKFLDKIKENHFNNKQPYDQIKSVCKSKKLSDTEKFRKCLDLLGYYYINKHENQVEYETYETYFEEFYVNGVRDNEKFFAYLDAMNKCINGLISRSFQGHVKDLKNVEVETLTENEKVIYNKVLECTNMFFPKDVDYERQYFTAKDPEAYRKVSDNILSDVVDDYKQKNKNNLEGEELTK